MLTFNQTKLIPIQLFIVAYLSFMSSVCAQDLHVEVVPSSGLQTFEEYDLHITYSGPPTGFSGLIEVQTSDGHLPLNGLVTYYGGDPGTPLIIEDLAYFQTAGALTITVFDPLNPQFSTSTSVDVSANPSQPPSGSSSSSSPPGNALNMSVRYPLAGSKEVISAEDSIRLRFDREIDLVSLTNQVVNVEGQGIVPVQVSLSADAHWLEITPQSGSWPVDQVLQVIVSSEAGLQGVNGEALQESIEFQVIAFPTNSGPFDPQPGTSESLAALGVSDFFIVVDESGPKPPVEPTPNDTIVPPVGWTWALPWRYPGQPSIAVYPGGSALFNQHLLSTRGRVETLSLEISTLNRGAGKGIFAGWRLNFDTKFFATDSEYLGQSPLSFIDGKGQTHQYKSIGDFEWEGPLYFHEKVFSPDQGQTVIRRLKSGRRFVYSRFDTDGFAHFALTSVVDTHGNTITIIRNPDQGGRKIATITDELGRSFTFYYVQHGELGSV